MTTDSSPPQSSVPATRIVAAEGIDRRACRMLLPDKPGVVGWSQLLVAKGGRKARQHATKRVRGAGRLKKGFWNACQ